MTQNHQLTLRQILDYFQNSIEVESKNSNQTVVLNDNDQNNNFDDNAFIELHKVYGNSWKKISVHFQSRNDLFIKNRFYSLLRRALRKVNSYLKIKTKLQNRRQKLLKLNFVFKLTNLTELERSDSSNQRHYKFLLYELLSLRNQNLRGVNCKQDFGIENYFERIENQRIQKLTKALRQIQTLFLINSLNKKGKSKKKYPNRLILKKDQIKKSMDQMEMKYDQKTTGFHTNDFFSPISTQCLSQEKQEQMRSFDLMASDLSISNSTIQQKNEFDPILFN